MAFIIFFALSLLIQGALGELMCENLPIEMCSFAIASSGNRCLLETSTKEDSIAKRTLSCKTSQAIAAVMNEYIETDSCIKACGVDRKSVGISSDNLLDSRFTRTLCSPRCLNDCPNIVDLYHNLALGEGLNLPDLCTRVKTVSRRGLEQSLAAGPNASPSSFPVWEWNDAIAQEALSEAAADSPVPVEVALAAESPAAHQLNFATRYMTVAAAEPA